MRRVISDNRCGCARGSRPARRLLCALIPDHLKRMMVTIMSVPAPTLRVAGLAAAVVGVGIVWLVRG